MGKYSSLSYAGNLVQAFVLAVEYLHANPAGFYHHRQDGLCSTKSTGSMIMKIIAIEAIRLRAEDPLIELFDGSYDDCVRVPQSPGLGVTLDMETIEHFRFGK
jgi:hypothetical protein